MELKVFAKKVRERISEELGEEFEVRLQEVTKNNNVTLQGLLILSRTHNVSPTIYLNPFWEAHEKGASLEAVVEKLLCIYREDTPEKDVNMEFFKNFKKVKGRICYRLIHREKNRKFLKGIPHIEFLDLAICFFYAYQGKVLGDGAILIHNSHMEMWKTDTAELLRLAQENSPRLFPWECGAMGSVAREILEEQEALGECCMSEEERQEIFEGVPMKVLSNTSRVHGAACILYPGVLERLAGEEGADLYILPSSVHEVILLPVDDGEREELLKEMIAEVNQTMVEPEDVLSDSLYRYDRRKKCVRKL